MRSPVAQSVSLSASLLRALPRLLPPWRRGVFFREAV
jgi:hypothetical protein